MINEVETQKRKQNMKLYAMYRAISMDIIFYYAIEFLFLTQVKNISASDVVLKSSFYALFMIIAIMMALMYLYVRIDKEEKNYENLKSSNQNTEAVEKRVKKLAHVTIVLIISVCLLVVIYVFH